MYSFAHSTLVGECNWFADGRWSRALRHRDRANRRIGRMFQRFSRAAHLYDVEISEIADPDHKSGKRLSIDISVREDLRQ